MIIYIAVLSMAVDHWNWIVNPVWSPWLYAVGRLAMPVFCVLVGYGLVVTRDRRRYAWRLTF